MPLTPRRAAPDVQALARLAALAPEQGGWVAPVPQREWSYDAGRADLEQDRREPEPTLGRRLRQGRVDPGRRGVAALGLVAGLAVAVTAVVVLRGRPQALEGSTLVTPGSPVASAAASVPASAPAVLVVAVSGEVRRPGLVRLPPGARVDDAIRAAGGAKDPADLVLVNLARKVADGEQVLVGAAAPAGTAGGGGGGSGGGSAGGATVDLNAATAEQLDGLPGIGPVLAGKIVAYREEHGRFGSVDQLREVSGIGESRFRDLEPLVRV